LTCIQTYQIRWCKSAAPSGSRCDLDVLWVLLLQLVAASFCCCSWPWSEPWASLCSSQSCCATLYTRAALDLPLTYPAALCVAAMPAHWPPDCVIRRLNCTMNRHSPPPCVCGIDTDTSVCVHTAQQSCSECLQSNYQKINLWTRAHPLLETIARELPPLLQPAAPCFIQDLYKRQRQTHREAGRGSYILMML
jgi:hypothetical protein